MMTGLPTFDPGFSTPAMTVVWSAEARVAAMLDVEQAVAAAQAEAGLIAPDELGAITAAIHGVAARLDASLAAQILTAGWDAGTPVIPLLVAIREGAPLELLHHRVTTQDIVDSAMMVQVSRALRVVDDLIDRVVAVLHPSIGVIGVIGDQPVMARTLLQPAAPTTVAGRVQRWIDPLVRRRAELAATGARLPVQLGGPIGDRAGLADDVVAGVARRLGLTAVDHAWHTDRAPISEVVALVERTVSWVAKIAYDVVLLSQPEIGEVQVRAGGSSAMAHKRNPIDAVRALAAADACHGAASIITAARPHEFERAAGSWHAEWFAIPLVFHTAAAALDAIGSMELRFTD